MKLVSYLYQNQPGCGFLSEDGQSVISFSGYGLSFSDLGELIGKMTLEELLQLTASQKAPAGISLSDITLLAPIPHPYQDILCLGINYMEHAAESARFKNETFNGERPYAVYFSKRVNEAVAPLSPILSHPDICDSLDYEAELAVVLGKDAEKVSKEDACHYIFGYTILNDVSARTIQNRHKQWYFGKSLEGFAPMGPVLVTADEIAFPPRLEITSFVNGELRQHSNTSLLIFGIDHVIWELSQGMKLKRGTVISTGTPAGVGMGFVPPKYLHSGDTVECRIEGIGSLKNPVQ